VTPFTLVFHILAKLVVLATLFAWWRGFHLSAYVMAKSESEDRWADVREPAMAAPAMAAPAFAGEPLALAHGRFIPASPTAPEAAPEPQAQAVEPPPVHVPPALLAAQPEEPLVLNAPLENRAEEQPHMPVDVGSLPMHGGGMQHTLH